MREAQSAVPSQRPSRKLCGATASTRDLSAAVPQGLRSNRFHQGPMILSSVSAPGRLLPGIRRFIPPPLLRTAQP